MVVGGSLARGPASFGLSVLKWEFYRPDGRRTFEGFATVQECPLKDRVTVSTEVTAQPFEPEPLSSLLLGGDSGRVSPRLCHCPPQGAVPTDLPP